MKRWLGMIGLLLVLVLASVGGGAVRAQGELAELHIQKVVLDPAVPFEQGRVLDVNIDIVNTGQRDASGFKIEYAWRPLGSQGSWTTFFVDDVAGLRILDQEVTRTASLDTAALSVGTSDPIGQQTTFELRITIDSENQITELDENNNRLMTSFTVLPNVALGKPDLRPRTVDFDPVSPVSVNSRRLDGSSSDVITISSVVENIGDSDAGPFNVQISYCDSPVSQGSPTTCTGSFIPLDTKLESQDSRALGGLSKGGSLAFSADLTFRDANRLLIDAGTYIFQVVVDPADSGFTGGEVDEQDEANNILTGFLTIRGPELRPTRIELGASPVRLGDVVDVIATISNSGSSSAPAGYLVTFSLDGLPFGSANGPSIDPGGEGTVSVQLHTNDFSLDPNRPYTITVNVDATNRVFEPDETNNTLETAVTLLPGAPTLAELHPKDIVMTPPSPIQFTPGMRVMVNSFIVNTGSAPAVGFNIEFSYRVQGTQRWLPIPCVIPANNCQNISLGRGQEVLAQGEVPAGALSPGVTYDIRASVDTGNSVAELDENNNDLGTTFSVRVPRLPDAAINAVRTVPQDLSQVRAGQQIQIVATVSNVGELPVNQTFEVSCELVSLSDFTFTPQQCPGQPRILLNGLDVNEDREVTFLVSTAGLQPGPYEIVVTADSTFIVDEISEANNVFRTGIDPNGTALFIQGVDLAVFPVFNAPLPTVTTQGERIDFTVQLNNDGTENAPNFVVALTVNCGAITRSDRREFLGLAAGQSLMIEFSFGDIGNPLDPTGVLPVGLCDVNVVADPDNEVLETNELNNALFPVGFGVQLDVQPSLADLSPIALEYPATPVSPGANVAMLARITNTGGAFFTRFTVRFSFCRFDTNQNSLCDRDTDFTQFPDTQSVTGDPIAYGLVEVNGAPAESELRVPTTLITNGLGGSYILRVEVDFLNDIEEVDEENNTLIIQAPLVVGSSSGTPTGPVGGSGGGGGDGSTNVPPGTQSEADLVITNFNLPSSLVPAGSIVNIDFTVLNQGVQDASAFVVRVFYNNNSDSGDGLHEIARINVDGLAAKQSVDLRARFDTSGLGSSRYNIIVIVDVFNQVQESFEGNNRQERWLKIT